MGNNSIINIRNGEYKLNNNIIINKNLEINGENKEQTIINCNGFLGFIIFNTDLTFNNLTFINGDNINLSENNNTTSKINPGVIYAKANVILSIDNCIFTNNTGKKGSALFTDGPLSKINITNTLFYNNNVTERAGVLHIGGERSNSSINNCTFINNKVNAKEVLGSKGNGGAIYLGGFCSLILSNSNFMNQEAINGSCIYILEIMLRSKF